MHAGTPVLVDTGPLVALFDPSDRDHHPCRKVLATMTKDRLVTSLAVVTEATYLLGFSTAAQAALLSFLGAGAVETEAIAGVDLERAAVLMKKYADLPMDFADATLVVLAERLSTTRVFTLDKRDFGIYRLGRRRFRLLP